MRLLSKTVVLNFSQSGELIQGQVKYVRAGTQLTIVAFETLLKQLLSFNGASCFEVLKMLEQLGT